MRSEPALLLVVALALSVTALRAGAQTDTTSLRIIHAPDGYHAVIARMEANTREHPVQLTRVGNGIAQRALSTQHPR